jgi:hypothetical protein
MRRRRPSALYSVLDEEQLLDGVDLTGYPDRPADEAPEGYADDHDLPDEAVFDDSAGGAQSTWDEWTPGDGEPVDWLPGYGTWPAEPAAGSRDAAGPGSSGAAGSDRRRRVALGCVVGLVLIVLIGRGLAATVATGGRASSPPGANGGRLGALAALPSRAQGAVSTTSAQGGAVSTSSVQGGAVSPPSVQGGAVSTSSVQGGVVSPPSVQGGAVSPSSVQGGAVSTPLGEAGAGGPSPGRSGVASSGVSRSTQARRSDGLHRRIGRLPASGSTGPGELGSRASVAPAASRPAVAPSLSSGRVRQFAAGQTSDKPRIASPEQEFGFER